MTIVKKKLDVITVGRAGVDLYGQQVGGRLETIGSFAKYVGGCPANIAVGTSRLGLKSAILTRVGSDHMGRFVREALEQEGVSTAGIVDDPTRLTALVLLGIRDADTFPLLFYRENCADMALSVDDVDEAFIASSRSVLLSGTHFSTPGVRAASLEVIRIAKANGAKVLLDVDYRPVLWGLTPPEMGEERFIENADVTSQLQAIVADCDLIVGTEEELHILGGTTNTLDAIKAIRKKSNAQIVCKRGEHGCVVFDGEIPPNLDGGISAEGFPVEVYNVLGAGDAFFSGFLRGWLHEEPLEVCCRYGNASGAIVVSRHGCSIAIPTWRELEEFLHRGIKNPELRKDRYLEHVHWATTRYADYPDLTVLAIDHRSQMTDIATAAGADQSRISEFKSLALRALDEVAGGDSGFGMLADSRFGNEVLHELADLPYWIGRPIELPGSRPLEFECSPDVATEITEWPLNHVVKCLVFYHPDDDADLKARQERQILRLYDACRATRHELLLEIICSQHGPVNRKTVATVMQRIYEVGVRPDWWKLEPCTDLSTWENIAKVIEDNDEYCRGIVMLGLAGNADDLVKSFAIAAKCEWVKGFAVGRTVFANVVDDWLRCHINDDQAVALLKQNFRQLVDAWRSVRPLGDPVTDSRRSRTG